MGKIKKRGGLDHDYGRKIKLSNLHTNGNNKHDNYCALEHWFETIVQGQPSKSAQRYDDGVVTHATVARNTCMCT